MDHQHGELITNIYYIPLSPEFISQQYTLCTFSTCSVYRYSSPTVFSLMGPDLVGQVHMDTVNDFQDHPGAKQLGSHWSVCTDSQDGELDWIFAVALALEWSMNIIKTKPSHPHFHFMLSRKCTPKSDQNFLSSWQKLG